MELSLLGGLTEGDPRVLRNQDIYRREVNQDEKDRVQRFISDNRTGVLMHDVANRIFTYIPYLSLKQLLDVAVTLKGSVCPVLGENGRVHILPFASLQMDRTR